MPFNTFGNQHNEMLKPNQVAQDAGSTGMDMGMSSLNTIKSMPSMGAGNNKFNELLKPNQSAQDAGSMGADMSMSSLSDIKSAPRRPMGNMSQPKAPSMPTPQYNYTPNNMGMGSTMPKMNTGMGMNTGMNTGMNMGSGPGINSTMSTPSMPTTGGFRR